MKIGFLLSHYGDNDLARAFIKSSNALLEKHHGIDIIGFVGNQVRPASNPSFATMNINECFDYDGVVIATNLDSAEKLARFPGPRRRYYYLWELDWTKNTGRTFEELVQLFNNPKLTIVARTPEDKRVIEQCWNCSVHATIPDCDMEAFVEMVRKDDKN